MKDRLKNCFKCGASILAIYGEAPGVPEGKRPKALLFDPAQEERFIVHLDSTGNWQAAPVPTLKLHVCDPTTLARLELEEIERRDKRETWMKRQKLEMYSEERCKPYEVTCPQCARGAGERCRDLRRGAVVRDTLHPHRDRLTAGLDAQGLMVAFSQDLNSYVIRRKAEH